jgi:hypothetical protein
VLLRADWLLPRQAGEDPAVDDADVASSERGEDLTTPTSLMYLSGDRPAGAVGDEASRHLPKGGGG